MRGVNGAGTGAESNEVQFAIGPVVPAGPPGAPTGLTAAVSGRSVTLTWASGPGGAVVDYVLEAGRTPGASDVGVFPVGSSGSFAAGAVPPGDYYARVRARNAAGTGPASKEIMLAVR